MIIFGIFGENVIDIRSKSGHNREEIRDRYPRREKAKKLPPRATGENEIPFLKGGGL
jgi:hypothetical protein